jgi:Ca2+-binding RTX toxin-like protein
MSNAPRPNQINGSPGNDFIIIPLSPPSMTGRDIVAAGSGDDTIVVTFTAHAGAPLIFANGGLGDDWIDTSTLNASPAIVNGGPGNDTLIGGAFVADTLIGSQGSDTIWMGGGDQIGADGADRLLLDARAGGGTINIQGATNTTTFDFSSLSPLHLESPAGPIALPDPFTIARGDLTFDAAGNLEVNHGDYHATLAGFPYHDSASLDAAIAAGHVILA